MWGRSQVWLAIALCMAIFVTFLVHTPACSSGNMLHNKPVPKFKAVSADTYFKSGIGAAVEIAVSQPVVASVPLQAIALAAAGDTPTPESPGPQVLSCCFLC